MAAERNTVRHPRQALAECKPWTAESVFLSGSPGTLFSDGSFEFSRVTAGRYTLQAREGPPGGRTAESDIDPLTRTVEGADVALTGGPQGYTTRAAADGTFEFPPVLPGQYTLMIRHFGFTNVTETVVVAGQDVNREFKSTPLY